MPRPRKCRKVCSLPIANEFNSKTESTQQQDVIIMTVDEYETIRLIDYQGFSQEECSEYMKIARTTVQQIYNNARKKLSNFLVNGQTLRIEGGEYQLCDGKESYCNCGGCRKHQNEKENKL